MSSLGRPSPPPFWLDRAAGRISSPPRPRRNNMGVVLRDEGKVKEAIALYDKCIALCRDLPEVCLLPPLAEGDCQSPPPPEEGGGRLSLGGGNPVPGTGPVLSHCC